MEQIKSESIDLVVTSPPYPMIEMWDNFFSEKDPNIRSALDANDGPLAFELMHHQLDPVWKEMLRVVKEGGFICINIGDATRSIGGNFSLFSNHAKILNKLISLGFTPLPCILWRKQTNAPNKFMGSGTLPSGAYVTLEHEYILIFRKGSKRIFNTDEIKQKRRESSIFWEERNNWYSDVWMDIKGASQDIKYKDENRRSAAYPFELVYRLINMYSIQGDIVLDPFLGTATTIAAAMASGRNSIGYESDETLKETIFHTLANIISFSNNYISDRIKRHLQFVIERKNSGKQIKYTNKHYDFQVITSFEQELLIRELESVEFLGNDTIRIHYFDHLNIEYASVDSVDAEKSPTEQSLNRIENPEKSKKKVKRKPVQLHLY